MPHATGHSGAQVERDRGDLVRSLTRDEQSVANHQMMARPVDAGVDECDRRDRISGTPHPQGGDRVAAADPRVEEAPVAGCGELGGRVARKGAGAESRARGVA